MRNLGSIIIILLFLASPAHAKHYKLILCNDTQKILYLKEFLPQEGWSALPFQVFNPHQVLILYTPDLPKRAVLPLSIHYVIDYCDNENNPTRFRLELEPDSPKGWGPAWFCESCSGRATVNYQLHKIEVHII